MKPRRPAALRDTEELDAQLANLIDDALKNNLGIKQKRFEIEKLQITVSYSEFAQKIRNPVIERGYLAALKDFFFLLPKEYDILERELKMIFKKIILNAQDSQTYIDEMNSYTETLESDLEAVNVQVAELLKEVEVFELEKEKSVAQAKLEAYDETMIQMKKMYPLIVQIAEKFSVKEKQTKEISDIKTTPERKF